MAKHGVFVSEQSGTAITPVVAESGLPFVVGVSPIQAAEDPATAGTVVLCSTYEEAVKYLGYSDDWDKYTLCEFMYAHFKVFGCSPVIFYNVLNPATATHKEASAEASYTVTDHQASLPIEAINDSNLVVKNGSTTLVKNTDYKAFYSGEYLVVELLSTGSAYSATTLTIGFNKVKPSGVTTAEVATAMEKAEYCLTTLGTIPDLIVAPKYSMTASVASAMAVKADSINGMFKAKAIVDIDCSTATTPTTAITKKATDVLTSEAEIVCWPKAKIGTYTFHLSSLIAGLIAKVDTGNDGCPYESPSNKAIGISALVIGDGTELQLTLAEANTLNNAGIVTSINFINGWTAWGNYTACYPTATEVKDYFIPISRMFGWVGNTLIKTFWSQLDKPMNRRLIDTILDTSNVWLNGLVGKGCLLGARVEMLDDENPLANLMAGIIKLHVYITPPAPAQEIDFVLEYDSSYVESALS